MDVIFCIPLFSLFVPCQKFKNQQYLIRNYQKKGWLLNINSHPLQ